MVEPQPIETIRRQVQHNCHVADACHAKEYGLCTYLMKMREYFRWEQGLGFDDPLSMDEVGEWLTRRERLWNDLQEAAFQPLQIDGRAYDPFDVAAVNGLLLEQGLVYSGGITQGHPYLHLGAVSARAPEDSLYRERCLQLGRIIARKALELFQQ